VIFENKQKLAKQMIFIKPYRVMKVSWCEE